ncbi:MAG: asparaginase [Gammaproteobacteria bacterium]|nr:asparaginase [Gammaproteobacteria bacterium]
MDRLRIFTVGGTIDKIYFDARSEYEVGEPQIGDILRETAVGFSFAVTSLMRKDSLDMTDADRALIRDAVHDCAERHVLITHGTDTMTETATALHGVSGKTIVLTGALNPARFRGSDAIFNIGSAVIAVQIMQPGVYIVMNGRVFHAFHVRKNRDKNRFEDV